LRFLLQTEIGEAPLFVRARPRGDEARREGYEIRYFEALESDAPTAIGDKKQTTHKLPENGQTSSLF